MKTSTHLSELETTCSVIGSSQSQVQGALSRGSLASTVFTVSESRSAVSTALASTSSAIYEPYVPPIIPTSSILSVEYNPTPTAQLSASGGPQVPDQSFLPASGSAVESGSSATIGVHKVGTLAGPTNPHSLCLPVPFEKAIECFDVVKTATLEAGICPPAATPIASDTDADLIVDAEHSDIESLATTSTTESVTVPASAVTTVPSRQSRVVLLLHYPQSALLVRVGRVANIERTVGVEPKVVQVLHLDDVAHFLIVDQAGLGHGCNIQGDRRRLPSFICQESQYRELWHLRQRHPRS